MHGEGGRHLCQQWKKIGQHILVSLCRFAYLSAHFLGIQMECSASLSEQLTGGVTAEGSMLCYN